MAIKQERWTHIDTIEHQKNMIMFVRGKINGKPYFMDNKTPYEYYENVGNSLLGQGPLSKIVPQITVDNVCIPLGQDVHHFAVQMMWLRGPVTTLTFRGKEYKVESKKMWETLLHYFEILFPRAQTEALHMSSEKSKMTKRSMGFKFDSTKKLE